MKYHTSLLVSLIFTLVLLIPVQAQEEDKIKIDVTIDKDGETRRIIKEFDKDQLMENIQKLKEELNDLEGVDVNVIMNEIGERDVFVASGFSDMISGKERPFLGITGKTGENGTVVITKVIEGTAAEKAGLQTGDIVLKADGESMDSYQQLVDAIRSKEPGDKMKITVDRNGKKVRLEAKLEKQSLRHLAWKVKRGSGDNEVMAWRGNKLLELKNRPYVGISYSGGEKDVLITKVMNDSPAEKAGLKRGDIITAIDGKSIEERGLLEFLNEAEESQKMKLTIQRGEEEITKTVKLGEKKTLRTNSFFNSDHVVDFDRTFVFVTLIEKEEEEMLSKALGADISNMEEPEDVEISVFPNPSNGEFNINISNDSREEAELKVFNSKGEQLQSYTLPAGQINQQVSISNQPAGNYFVVLQQGDRLITKKLIKK